MEEAAKRNQGELLGGLGGGGQRCVGYGEGNEKPMQPKREMQILRMGRVGGDRRGDYERKGKAFIAHNIISGHVTELTTPRLRGGVPNRREWYKHFARH